MPDRPHPDDNTEFDSGKYVRMNKINKLEEENKKLNVEIVRLKSLLHSAGLDLKKAEEVRLKLVNKLNKK